MMITNLTFVSIRYQIIGASVAFTIFILEFITKLQKSSGDELPLGYENNRDQDLSKYAKYNYYNHDINAGLNLIREKYRYSAV